MSKIISRIIPVILLILFGCRSEIKEDRVKKEASRSLEIALDYIKQQRVLHEFDLNRKIRLVGEKVSREQNNIQKGAGSKAALQALQLEKADLEKKLKILIANTGASTKRITEKWNRYNQSLDAMLNNMQDYLKGIPIDTDTLPQKDSLRHK